MKYLERSFSVASGFGEGAPKEERFGRWIWDERQQKLVRYEDYAPPSRALDAPIMTDRWYEGQHTLDGADIGSRAKRKELMKARGWEDGNDVTPAYFERQRAEQARSDKRERHATVAEAYKALRDGYRPPPRGTYED